MAMSRDDFKNALREAVSAEFAEIPTDEDSIDYTFSERFEKRMNRLLKLQRKPYWKYVNTASKRAAVIIAAVLTVFTAAFSVKAIREPIISFIKQVYETFTHYSFGGDEIEKITKEYKITVLPDGFKQTDKIQNDNCIITEYTNASGDSFDFRQMTTEYSAGYFVNNEFGEIRTETVGGIEVEFKTRYDTQSAIWTKDGYVFEIDVYKNISIDTIKEMILAVG